MHRTDPILRVTSSFAESDVLIQYPDCMDSYQLLPDRQLIPPCI